MPRYLLDTHICIYLIKHQPVEVAERFAQCYRGDVVMSAVTSAELQFGVVVAADPTREAGNLATLVEDIQVVPFHVAAAVTYGLIHGATRESRKDHLDKLIAAHAVSLDVILVTNNEADFARHPELRAENWVANPASN